MKTIRYSIRSLLLIFSLHWIILCALSTVLFAGDWRVMPIRLDFGGKIRTGIVTVINESSDKLQVQMKASQWTQDAQGKDQYTDTSEIIFFPKILILNGKEERIIRVGTKTPPGPREKAYRLFIEETPSKSGKDKGVALNIAIRFGLPIFLQPRKANAAGRVDGLTISTGTVSIPIANTGNVHFKIRSIELKGSNAQGKEAFSKSLTGWYLMSGSSRTYTLDLPADACRELSRIDAVVNTDKLTLKADLTVTGDKCGP